MGDAPEASVTCAGAGAGAALPLWNILGVLGPFRMKTEGARIGPILVPPGLSWSGCTSSSCNCSPKLKGLSGHSSSDMPSATTHTAP
jgi:hypothetical protein